MGTKSSVDSHAFHTVPALGRGEGSIIQGGSVAHQS